MVIAVLTVEYHLHGNDSSRESAVSPTASSRRCANVQRRHRRIRHGGFPDPSPADGHFLSNSEQHLQSRMDKCLAMMEAVCSEEMVYSDLEFINGD